MAVEKVGEKYRCNVCGNEVTVTKGTHLQIKNPNNQTHTVSSAATTKGNHIQSIEEPTSVIQVHQKITATSNPGSHSGYIGSWIIDDFDSGVYDPWWDSDYTDDWSLSLVPPTSSDYVSVRGSDGEDRLTPSPTLMYGDFILEAGIRLGGTNTGANRSVHLEIFDSLGVRQCGIYWDGYMSIINWYNNGWLSRDSVAHTYTQYDLFRIKMERISGVITAYYDIGGGWVAFSNPYTFSGGYYIVADGCDEHGFSDFDFWSGSGFPNP